MKRVFRIKKKCKFVIGLLIKKCKLFSGRDTYKKLAVRWLNKALCYVSSLVLADSIVLRNRQLLVAAKRCAIYLKKTKRIRKMKENLSKIEHLQILENEDAEEMSKNLSKIGYRKLGYTDDQINKIMGIEEQPKVETKTK
ncbi:MAG: hypothetical protein EAZ64_06990 [Sphingobacteriales bacterium]|nr:MAG: hypothetical protein EAZ64_06990 [Sphingobacteriales bacterium]